MLCGLLRSTGVAGRPESYFRLPNEDEWADRWSLARNAAGRFDYGDLVRAAVAEGRTANGVFGGRVMWGTLDEMVLKLGAVHPSLVGARAGLDLLERAFGRTRFVHLRRDDTIAQAVSWARAEQTRFWQDGDTAEGGSEPCYDFEQIDALVRTIEEHNAAWLTWFGAAGVEPYVVRYEELTADPAGVTRGILDFLGLSLPAGCELVPGHRRQADQLNDDWIARYRAATAG